MCSRSSKTTGDVDIRRGARGGQQAGLPGFYPQACHYSASCDPPYLDHGGSQAGRRGTLARGVHCTRQEGCHIPAQRVGWGLVGKEPLGAGKL